MRAPTVGRICFVALLALVLAAGYIMQRDMAREWIGNVKLAGLVLVVATAAAIAIAHALPAWDDRPT